MIAKRLQIRHPVGRKRALDTRRRFGGGSIHASQGEMLIEHGLTLRPDWETVIKAVVDFALTLLVVDPARIALSGWSFGGHLAPRAASGEHRLGACIADPGLWALASANARVL